MENVVCVPSHHWVPYQTCLIKVLQQNRSVQTAALTVQQALFLKMPRNDSLKTCMGSPVCPGVLAQVRRQGCLPCSGGL